jgi:hypothetical protein
MITIDGTSYNIPVISIKRKADFLDKYAWRTLDGVLHRELIGVYFNYQLQLGRTNDLSVYSALWDKLTEPVEFHTVTVPGIGGTTYTFTAYFSSVGDEMLKLKDNIGYWKSLTVHFIGKSPARR